MFHPNVDLQRMLLIWQRTRMMTLRKPLLSVYRRHRYTIFEWAILVQKAEMLSFISNPYIEPCFSTEKEILTHHFLLKLRAVKKVLDSRLVKNSRRLWNLDQRYKFLRAEADRDILKFRVWQMAFSVVFKRYFPLRTQCFFIRIHARLGTMLSKCTRRSTTWHGSHISQS